MHLSAVAVAARLSQAPSITRHAGLEGTIVRAEPFFEITLLRPDDAVMQDERCGNKHHKHEASALASLEAETASNYVINGIKSRADALANLPSRARWFPQGDAAIRQRNGSRGSQPSSVKLMEGFYVGYSIGTPR